MNLIITHSADNDGKLSELLLAHAIDNGSNTVYFPWDYNLPWTWTKEQLLGFDIIYMADISHDILLDPDLKDKIIWIDHHKTAIDKYTLGHLGLRIDGVAACRLVHLWITSSLAALPPTTVKEFNEIIKTDTEPYLVKLLGEHDVWNHEDPNSWYAHYGYTYLLEEFTRSSDHTVDLYSKLTRLESKVLEYGKVIHKYADSLNKENYKLTYCTTIELDGVAYNLLTLNSLSRGSQQFDYCAQEGYDGLMKWNETEDGYDFSLYHTKHNKNIDLSVIAKSFGGGGHKGACGFRTKELPEFLK